MPFTRCGEAASCNRARFWPLSISTFAAIRSPTRGHSCGHQDMTAGDIPTIQKLACVRKEAQYFAICSGTISRDSPISSASFRTGARLLACVNSIDNLYVPEFVFTNPKSNMPSQPMPKRGFNCQEAMTYLGVKRRAFDLHFRPYLPAARLGTSVVFDRIDLDRILDEHKNRNGRPCEKGDKSWADSKTVFTVTSKVIGGSTRSIAERDFASVSARILKKGKAG